MPRYSTERKAAVLKKLLPPENRSIPEVAAEEGISEGTLYNWRQQARERGIPVPGSGKQSEDWSAEAKFAVVVETASLSEAELSAYCRSKGLYPEQVRAWKEAFIQGALSDAERRKRHQEETRKTKRRIKELEKELRRKDKALAETAALLALRKKLDALWGEGRRGRLTPAPERQQWILWIEEAVAAGARKRAACEEIGISLRTLQRWTEAGAFQEDQRLCAQRPEPRNKLTEEERHRILSVCNSPEFASKPPTQIVPTLADRGEYIASESSFYRVLKAAGQLHHRGRAKPRKPRKPPSTFIAKAPNQVWTWDITYLPSSVKGLYYYLYLVEDIYSRKGVAWEVHESESGEYAATLMQRAMLREQCFSRPPVLHSDNGAPMKSQTLRAKLHDLGIQPSHSRPRVSNDNPYSESLFRTVKYNPDWPSKGFASLDEARHWVEGFMQWYNHEHLHSGIKYVTPADRHDGKDVAILSARDKVQRLARERNPLRWTGKTRNWAPIGSVALNPQKENLANDIAA
ncbi:IS3 family transposase [Microbulbifer thermotolerans]|uniref:IS3 family transposase n=1 Tax=Microbulbifer thermotolerans TaxID=252514 RepID=UPI003F5A309B